MTKYVFPIIFFALLLFTSCGLRQNKALYDCNPQYHINFKKTVFLSVDSVAIFENGFISLWDYIGPRLIIEQGYSVKTTFMTEVLIDESGKIINAGVFSINDLGEHILKFKDNDTLTDVEILVLHILLKMPPWKPALCNNKPVMSTVRIPIRFIPDYH